MKQRIPYTKPSITELEQAYAADAVATGWGEKCYDYLNRFDVSVQFAIFVNIQNWWVSDGH